MISNSTYLIFYLILCFVLGFFRIPKIKSLKEYALGNNQFSTWVLSFSLIATLIGPELVMGVAEKSYALGIVYIIPLCLIVFRWWFLANGLGNSLILLKQHKCMTLVDIMHLFFGSTGRFLCAGSVIIQFLILGILYKTAGIVLERYSGISMMNGALIIAISIALYSIFGGIHAVVITDVVQFFIFMTILPCILLIGFYNIDFSTVMNDIPYEKAHVTHDDVPLLLSLIIYGIIPSTGFPFIQRGLMCENKMQLKKVFNITGIICFFFMLLIATSGFLALSISPDIKSDDAIFAFIEKSVPPQIFGFIAISFLAIIMSTASSLLNSANVIIMKDIFEPIFPKLKNSKTELFITQIIGIFVVIISFFTIFIDKKIIDMFWTIENFWDPIVSIPLMTSLFGYRIPMGKFKYVIITSLTSVLIARYFHTDFDTITWSVGVIVSLITIIVLRRNKAYELSVVTH